MKKAFRSILTAFCLILMLLPISALAADNSKSSSGTCGNQLSWTLDESGTLTISGVGAMSDYSEDSPAPWSDRKEAIQTVKISDSVMTIGESAFEDCVNLTDVSIPESVTYIVNYAFCNCNRLTRIHIPDSVAFLGRSSFDGCSSLTSVAIPISLTSISFEVFQDCSNLTSIYIPDSVTAIALWAFDGCENLKDVYYSGSEKQWKKIEISSENDALVNATIHYNSGNFMNVHSHPQKPVSKSGFSDVQTGYYADDAIAWVYRNGYMTGTSATTFDPDGKISRQQLWMILARLSGEAPANAEEARNWAISNQISDGTKATETITRQQMMVFLYRYGQSKNYQLTGSASLTDFSDSQLISDYAQDALSWAVGNGIITGNQQGELNPTGSATRAQFAVILQRFYNTVVDKK